ncbi:GGDEF domain-containing protein [Trinickia symbiotica]|nr:GGDEF domain-containing protein [Trinickia symbiotica]
MSVQSMREAFWRADPQTRRGTAWLPSLAALARRFLRGLEDAERGRLQGRIRQLESEVARLSRLAVTDELTGAFNRRHIDEIFETRVASPGINESLAFCLFDIDGFKAYNDTYGHGAGDDALKQVAQAVHGQLRQSGDSLIRLGGDEFCILLRAESPADALAAIDRLRLAVRALALPHPTKSNAVLTASFGFVWRGARGATRHLPRDLYRHADRMLYEAKRAGRDTVRLAVL